MLKKYYAIVRGFTLDQGEITAPLASDSSGDMLESHTVYKTLARIELPYAVGKRHPTARYSFVEVQPLTGRFHQIRRHLARIGHPVLGDCTHGDSYHNRFFRETLEIPGLMLRSALLDFQDARNGERFAIKSSIWSEPWQNAFKRFAWSQP